MKKIKSAFLRNLILSFVLLITIVILVLAWFTYGSTSYADGINIRSKADGVQVSWDGVNYYDNLTELDKTKIVEDKTGLALNISGQDGVPAKLNLVTGNGLSFFEPYLNRRTGTVLTNGTQWEGIKITDDNSSGRYIDIDLYFRGTSPRDIYLAGDSTVLPKNTSARYSNYGAFSKDYISAASRVAFLNSDKDECSFIWAPNADVELLENESGYTRFTATEEEEVTISGGGSSDIDGGVVDNGKTYYFWTFWDDSVVTSYPNDLSKFEARKFQYDSKRRYFTTEVTTYIPTYGEDNPSIPIFINESDSASATSFNSYNTYIDGASSKNTIKESSGQFFGVTNTNFNIGSATCSNAMYIINGNIKPNAKITYELGYDPYNKLLVVLNYQVDGGGSFDLGGEDTDITTTIKYYPLPHNSNCTLVNPTASIAVSSGQNFKKSVQFSSSLNVLPVSITKSEEYTAEKTGDGYAATYKFKNKGNNKYLNISNGNIAFDATGSTFNLYYDSNFEGPLLKSGDYYLVVKNGTVSSVKLGDLEDTDVVTVYTGSSYKLNTGLTSDKQTYQYYDSEAGLLKNLGSTSVPPLFTSVANTSDTVKIGNIKIATLTKDTTTADDTVEATENTTEGSEETKPSVEYYTAHIVMRIWVEGTDREAKVPLADGIFNASFHFISQ